MDNLSLRSRKKPWDWPTGASLKLVSSSVVKSMRMLSGSSWKSTALRSKGTETIGARPQLQWRPKLDEAFEVIRCSSIASRSCEGATCLSTERPPRAVRPPR